jgi:hypothetical protein
MAGKSKKSHPQWSSDLKHSALLIACFGGACGSYSADMIFDAVTNSGTITIIWLPAWRLDMGIACIGLATSVVSLSLLQALAKESKRVICLSSLLWLPLVLVTALATIVHIAAYAVALAGVAYCVWAYHRMRTIR